MSNQRIFVCAFFYVLHCTWNCQGKTNKTVIVQSKSATATTQNTYRKQMIFAFSLLFGLFVWMWIERKNVGKKFMAKQNKWNATTKKTFQLLFIIETIYYSNCTPKQCTLSCAKTTQTAKNSTQRSYEKSWSDCNRLCLNRISYGIVHCVQFIYIRCVCLHAFVKCSPNANGLPIINCACSCIWHDYKISRRKCIRI